MEVVCSFKMAVSFCWLYSVTSQEMVLFMRIRACTEELRLNTGAETEEGGGVLHHLPKFYLWYR
jgi:hypothetical protein